MISFEVPSLPADLADKYSRAIADHLTECAEIAKSYVERSIESGEEINGGSFAPLSDVTIKVRELRGGGGSKPLIDSGNLLGSISVDDAYSADGEASVNLGAEYGQYQNEGYYVGTDFRAGGEFFKVKGTSVPSREFWGTPDDFFERPEYKKSYSNLDKKIQKILSQYPIERFG